MKVEQGFLPTINYKFSFYNKNSEIIVSTELSLYVYSISTFYILHICTLYRTDSKQNLEAKVISRKGFASTDIFPKESIKG